MQLAAHGDHQKELQQTKMMQKRLCGVQHQMINLTQLYLRFRHHNRREVGKTAKPKKHKVCYENASTRNVREARLMKFYQCYFLNQL